MPTVQPQRQSLPETPLWARVRGGENHGVRRGAWYAIVRLTEEDAGLDVNGRRFDIPRAVLQIVPGRPERWSVVARPDDAVDMPQSWGSRYAVCPSCAHRRSLLGQPTELQCPRCSGVFPVAWDDPY
jgi:hypothetical protein